MSNKKQRQTIEPIILRFSSPQTFASDLLKQAVERRREQGLTQNEVAQRMNKPQSFISKLESGRTPHVRIETVLSYCQSIGMPNCLTLLSASDVNNEELCKIKNSNTKDGGFYGEQLQ